MKNETGQKPQSCPEKKYCLHKIAYKRAQGKQGGVCKEARIRNSISYFTDFGDSVVSSY